jgi:hypothetical protein
MKKQSIVILLVIIITVFFSCKKDKETPQTPAPSPVTYANYSKLATGNYWVYQQYDVDSVGNATIKNVVDSCYIEKDTLINSQTYYKMYRPNFIPSLSVSYLRDSLHYIVNSAGKILFSSEDFSNVLESHYQTAAPGDTVCHESRKMTDQNMSVSTPYGVFTTVNAKETYNMYPNWSYHGSTRYIHVRYAQNVGVVEEILPFFAGSPNYVERRLLRYHVN